MGKPVQPHSMQGRGTPVNPDNRFHERGYDVFDDGWGSAEPVLSLPTSLQADASRTAIVYNSSPDVPFDRSINPYRGCEHGCVYCYARPTHAYLDCSPGLDFETRIFYKAEAASLLRQELSAKNYRCAPLALGANTDVYQPTERKLRITRSLLEVLNDCRHPVGIVTKSALVERDIDILAAMARRDLAHVMVSVTTLDKRLARTLEPRAAAPHRRLDLIARLVSAGIPTGVLVAPVIPFVNDNDLEDILTQARRAGALSAGYLMVRLPHEVKGLFQHWLDSHLPDRAERVMNRIRDMRGGRENDPRFGRRMTGDGVFAELVRQRFRRAVGRLEFPGMPDFNCEAFRPPAHEAGQLALFR